MKYKVKVNEFWMEESPVSYHLCIYIITLVIYACFMDALYS